MLIITPLTIEIGIIYPVDSNLLYNRILIASVCRYLQYIITDLIGLDKFCMYIDKI
jgi:hypothetical protein